MRIISMAYTSEAFEAGRKTVTRRQWKEHYAQSFKAGEKLQAWDKSPRVKGAKRIGTIILTAEPVFERRCDTPDFDFEAEGFAYYSERLLQPHWAHLPIPKSWSEFQLWRRSELSEWVIRFQKIDDAGTP